jgi:uncharacterized protein YdeI (BOF family)
MASLGQASATVTTVGGAPISPGLEWRLVSVTGTVEDVQRDGATWRAEIRVSGGTIPIAGIERSGISSTSLVEGRSAKVVGVVKRAYPTSTDQRLSVVPRSTADISLGGVGATSAPRPSGSPRPAGSAGPGPSARPTSFGITGSTPGGDTPGNDLGQNEHAISPLPASATVIAALSEHEGQLVRIGGRVVGVDGDGVFTVDDGTGTAVVRLTGDAATLSDQLQAGDLLNVTGMVMMTTAGTLEVTVDDLAQVARVPAPASLAAASDALAMASQAAILMGPDESPTLSTTGSNIPVMAVTLLLALFGVALAVVAAAGPRRRAKVIAAVQAASQSVRTRLQHGRAGTQHG